MAYPPFMCVLPCTNPQVKYLDRLDGCANGIHVTRADISDMQMTIYQRLSDAILANDGVQLPVQGTVTPGSCTVCKAPIVPRPTSPVLYMERCEHYYHHGCLCVFFPVPCPQCQVVSSRVLLWPELFSSAEAKNETFQLQKHSLGLDVAPQTVFKVNKCYVKYHFPAFEIHVNSKNFTVHKRPPRNAHEAISGANADFIGPRGSYNPDRAKMRARQSLLRKFWCPLVRHDGPNGERLQLCSYGRNCHFWHGWPINESPSKAQRAKLWVFPRFFCLASTSFWPSQLACSKRVQVDSGELDRCLAGFHPTDQDLKDVHGFACKMAKEIMVPVVVPEPEQSSLVCAFCPNEAQAGSVRLHLQNCGHWLHVQCLPQARLAHSTNPNRKLDLHCPSCQVPSVRTMAWPGPFPSSQLKQTIFALQLKSFSLNVKPDTQLAITEVANQVNVFTLDYGGPSVVTIDAAQGADGPRGTTIEYN